MNKLLVTAGVVSIGLTALHVFGGGLEVHMPLLESNASDVIKGFASVVWHSVTAALFLCSVLLFIAAQNRSLRRPFTAIVMIYYLSFATLFLFYGVVRLGSVFVMLPWIVFLLVVLIAAVGLWFDKPDHEAGQDHA